MSKQINEEQFLTDYQLLLQKKELIERDLLMKDYSALFNEMDSASLDKFVIDTDESGYDILDK